MKHKSIIEAIEHSNLKKFQKAIDKCNNKRGCNAFCSDTDQKGCDTLQKHVKEVESLDYEGKV